MGDEISCLPVMFFCILSLGHVSDSEHSVSLSLSPSPILLFDHLPKCTGTCMCHCRHTHVHTHTYVHMVYIYIWGIEPSVLDVLSVQP